MFTNVTFCPDSQKVSFLVTLLLADEAGIICGLLSADVRIYPGRSVENMGLFYIWRQKRSISA